MPYPRVSVSLLVTNISDMGLPIAQMAKKLPAMQETQAGSLGQEDTMEGEGNGNSFQYSCLENPMDRGACWATVHGVAKSQTQVNN